jgi:hypothetical protein
VKTRNSRRAGISYSQVKSNNGAQVAILRVCVAVDSLFRLEPREHA